eukprot:TRINITY_DN458_c0_g2_i1.p1 TRINITY_DN458_c0_g2~~TRINITY_DN458_c0_g2_i1.p1  ORF type:complete len:373 (-),score=50.17 TRINITY_DN458_c0_g2_i1:108-1226(-)
MKLTKSAFHVKTFSCICLAFLMCLSTPVHSSQQHELELTGDLGQEVSDIKKHGWYAIFSDGKKQKEGKDINKGGLVDMALLAQAIYGPSTRKVKGWKLNKVWNMAADGGEDWAGIYENKGKMCALAFSGSNDKGDWNNNRRGTFTTSWKGISDDAHRGFASEANQFLGKKFSKFKKTLRSKACGSGVIVLGHSLGGGIASLIAALANKHRYFTADFLYTLGAPGPTRTQLRNPANNGCFNGARVYNKDSWTGDPVPAASRRVGYVYPKAAALRLYNDRNDERKSYLYNCNSQMARDEPYRSGTIAGAGASSHKMVVYITRLQKTRIEHIGCLEPKKNRPKCPGEGGGQGKGEGEGEEEEEEEEEEEDTRWWR